MGRGQVVQGTARSSRGEGGGAPQPSARGGGCISSALACPSRPQALTVKVVSVDDDLVIRLSDQTTGEARCAVR